MTDKPATILIVDDEIWNQKVFESYLAPLGYHLIFAAGGDEALKKLSETSVDLILLDIMMPNKNGYEVCREIRQQASWQSIPIIMVSALHETANRIMGLEAGASDFLTKPVDSAELQARIQAHLRIKQLVSEIESWNKELEWKVDERTRELLQKTKELDESYFVTIEALITALDAREHETGRHSLRVAFYVTEMAKGFNLKGKALEEIALGALLHDIGKIGIPDHILLKPSSLTVTEWIEMRKHPFIGWQMVKNIEFLGSGRNLILQHQERFDGSGYPNKLKGSEIFLGARLFSVVDTFDVLMSERTYKKRIAFDASCEIIQKESGIAFDPDAVKMFLTISPDIWKERRDLAENCDLKYLIQEIRQAQK